MMKMTKMMPLATSLVVTFLHSSVSAGSQDPSSDDEEVAGIFRAPPAAQKKRAHGTAATTTFIVPAQKRRRAPQQPIFIIQDDNDSPPASGSSTCDPADDQDQTTQEQRVAQVLPLLSPEFREPLYRNQIDEFVLELESGRVFQNILTALRRIDTEDRFYAINWVRGILNKYPHLKDSDEDEIIETLEVYDGSKIVVPATPPSSQSR